jgi:hypothetical protein
VRRVERLSTLRLSFTTWRIVAARDDKRSESVGGTRIGKATRSGWRKPGTVPVCSPHIPT